MANDHSSQDDPLDFVRNMWGSMGFTLPGMMTPTLDVEELDKRIADMRAVEGWLRMNLNMLQMTIQGLEMQRATLAAVQAMQEQTPKKEPSAAETPADNPFVAATMWPWNLVQTNTSRQASSEKKETPSGSSTKPRAKRKPAPKRSS